MKINPAGMDLVLLADSILVDHFCCDEWGKGTITTSPFTNIPKPGLLPV